MFGALRRCSASLPRTLPSMAASSRPMRVSLSRPLAIIQMAAPRAPTLATASLHYATPRQAVVAEAQVERPQTKSDVPVTRFDELALRGLVHPNIVDVITRQMKLETMTDVQSRTINEALSGSDVIAQAKTGTGKTLGFLIPVVQRIVETDPKLAERPRGYKKARPDDIRAIVISPTRELAEQIAVEAKKITSGTGLVVQLAVGGTQKRAMLQKTQREGCHILIATPGRLRDILSDPYSGIKAPRLSSLVMDEADRLLDDGFSQEIEEIKTLLPNPEEVDRQTLMFSATIPREVVDLVRQTLRPGFHFAKCVSDDEVPTHHKVPQKLVHVEGFENIMPSLYELILQEHSEARQGQSPPFKAIVYFNSTAEVTLAASVFFKLSGGFRRDQPLSGMRAFEIHSKLTQAQRTRASDDFRFSSSAILFSSDVTARGMDFPNVTHVIQIGLPRDRESYIHRLGRTGRAGKEGEGWIFVTPFERAEVRRRLRDLPLKHDETLETAKVDMSAQSEMPENVATLLQRVVDAHKKVYPDQLDAAFRGLFGSFQWYADKAGLLEGANRLAEFGWGMPQPPSPPAFFGSGGRSRGNRDGRSFDRRSSGYGNRMGDRDFGGRSGGFGDRRNDRGFGGRSGGYADRRNDRGFDRRRGGFGARERGDRFDGLGREPDF